MANATVELAKEAMRRSESCLYTSSALFIYQRRLDHYRSAFTVIPIIVGSVATAKFFVPSPGYEWVTPALAFVGGLLPLVARAMKIEDRYNTSKSLGGAYKNLQDRFRHAAIVTAKEGFPILKKEMTSLMKKHDALRAKGFITPEWCFTEGQAKVQKGDYDFDVDVALQDDPSLIRKKKAPGDNTAS
jgi:hypothetical protein